MQLFRTIARLWRGERHTLYFLISSAIFRDGLAAIFTFGAVIAVGTFGFAKGDVLIFAIAGNVVAAIGAFSAGYFDDKLGPKTVIVISLVGLLVSGVVLFFSSGKTIFWISGLLLCLFLGPAQSSARTFVGRLAPAAVRAVRNDGSSGVVHRAHAVRSLHSLVRHTALGNFGHHDRAPRRSSTVAPGQIPHPNLTPPRLPSHLPSSVDGRWEGC